MIETLTHAVVVPAKAGTHNHSERLRQEIANPARVMAGLVPAIHFKPHAREDVDARVKPGHDGGERGAR
jgi:hypothetical protein